MYRHSSMCVCWCNCLLNSPWPRGSSWIIHEEMCGLQEGGNCVSCSYTYKTRSIVLMRPRECNFPMVGAEESTSAFSEHTDPSWHSEPVPSSPQTITHQCVCVCTVLCQTKWLPLFSQYLSPHICFMYIIHHFFNYSGSLSRLLDHLLYTNSMTITASFLAKE